MVSRGEPPNRLRDDCDGTDAAAWCEVDDVVVASVVPAQSVSFDMHGAFGCDHDDAGKPNFGRSS
jgi:hypothetical protein